MLRALLTASQVAFFAMQASAFPVVDLREHATNPLTHNLVYSESDPAQFLDLNITEDEMDELIQEMISTLPGKKKVSGPPQAQPEPEIIFNHDDMANPEDWKRKYFDVVVVINKAVYGQTLHVYRFGELVMTTKVSTGRERAEIANMDANNKHQLTKSYFSQTETGYFTPTFLNIDHVSKQWVDADMPYAVFFNEGIATHRAPRGSERKLGTRASGGCVRMTEKESRQLFWWVRLTGGPFRKSDELSKPLFTKEMHEATATLGQPYVEKPQIPVFTQTGELKYDEFGAVKMRNGGFKTLYVVENRYVEPPPPPPKKPAVKKPVAKKPKVKKKRTNYYRSQEPAPYYYYPYRW